MTVCKLRSHALAATLAVMIMGIAVFSQPALAVESPPPPTIVYEQGANANATGITLYGEIDPHGQQTTFAFEYSTEASGETLEGTIVKTSSESGSTNGSTFYAQSIIGGVLASAHTYYYRMVVEGENGTVRGPVQEFTTTPAPHTEAVTGIGATEATFHGTLTPLSATVPSEYSFIYRAGSGCGGEGATAASNAGTGSGSGEESTLATGLQPNASYSVCMFTNNAFSAPFGGQLDEGPPAHFKTLAAPPTIDSESASAITPFDATLEGQVNPNNQPSIFHLEYATDAAFTENVTTLELAVAHGYGDQALVADIGGGLTPNTTYYYRVVASNATGEVKGATQEVTTLTTIAPSISGELLTAATSSTDTIEAQINPQYQTVEACEVQYVLLEAFENTGFTVGAKSVPCQGEFGTGGSPVSLTATLTGMQENTPYEYRVVATNGTGTTTGTPLLLTRKPPTVSGEPEASKITPNTAVIVLPAINPQIEAPFEGAYQIMYGLNAADEMVTPRVSAGSGLVANPVATVKLENLKPGTTYHYAVVTSNLNGTEAGPEQTFTTAGESISTTPPTIGSAAAHFVNENSAVIEGEVNPEGLGTTYQVQYGTSAAYGASSPGSAAIAPLTNPQGTFVSLTGLAPGTTYHYRLVASSQAGTSYGPDETFTTSGAARTSAFGSFAVPSVPLLAVAPTVFPTEEQAGKAGSKPPTRAQKLAKALKTCKKKPKGSKRTSCERQARKKYGAKAKKHK